VSASRSTVFVCVSCRVPVEGHEGAHDKPGQAFASTLADRLHDAGATDIDVRPVECLSVCNRPCTVAFAGEGKWSYVVGGIEAEAHAEDIAMAARLFAASADGIIPWKERPPCFRKGVVARVPPQTYRLTETAE
jgi:predicted metal-binding protein